MTKTRLEAFSDAVIAIIMTIMVLELKVPHEVSWSAFEPLWPVFFSYIISFLGLGIYWGNHHHLIHTISMVSSGIIWSNMHLLFWLSLMPFATAWVGETHFDKVPLAVYAALATMCGVAYFILLIVIRNCNPVNDNLQSVLKKQQQKGAISCILYTLAIPVALFVNTIAASLLIIIASVIWLIPDRNIEKALHES